MTKLAIGSALAALATILPATAFAQQAPAAVVVLVDTQRLYSECTACKAAQTQLQAQANQLQQRAQQLGQPLQTEAEAIQKAAAGKAPDAALQQRIQALQTKETTANQELQNRQRAFARNRAYVVQQIDAKLGPIVQQVMQKRGANIAIDRGGTLAASSAIDVTNDVMTQLNAQLPSVSVNAPAEAAKPQGR